MTADVELLPLPPLYIVPSVEPVDYPDVAQALMDYARANVAHAVAPLQAEIEALRAEVATWEGLHASEVQVRQRWQARAERLEEALREAKEKMLAQVKWVACDCGCEQDKPADAVSVAWLRASTLLRDQEDGRG